MTRLFFQTASMCICTKGFSYVAVCGQRLNAFPGIQYVIDVAVRQRYCVPSTHILLSARRNYKKTRQLTRLTVEEQFILRVSGILSAITSH